MKKTQEQIDRDYEAYMKEHTYLTADDPDAFVDYPKQARPVAEYAFEDYSKYVECPACHGHGGWNLRLNAYPLHQYADTPENRHLYSHFRCHCNQCNATGWVEPENAQCVHDYAHELNYYECQERGIYHAGRCWHVYECAKCGSRISQDSSD